MLSHISLYSDIRDISLQYLTAKKELNCCTVLYLLFCWRYRLPYVSKLSLLFPVENHVNVLVQVQRISPKWHKSTKSVVFNLTEGS